MLTLDGINSILTAARQSPSRGHGGFVALALWLVPYYVNAYATSVALAGALAACNSLPSGVIRAGGGVYFSDPYYGPDAESLEQGGFHVYYVAPGGGEVVGDF